MTTLVHLFQLNETIRRLTASVEFQSRVAACLDAGETPKTVRKLIDRTIDHDVELAIDLHAEARKGAGE